MTAYLIRRFLTSLVVLLGVSIVVFVLLHTIYPSPAIDVLGIRTSPLSVAAWNKSHGFDDPFAVQYWHYLDRLAHGDLGYSYKLNQSVARLFGERWARSAFLSGSSLVLAVLIAVPLGIYQAVRRNTIGDSAATAQSFVAYAMPDFFFYLMAVQLLALTIPVFSFQASQSPDVLTVITDWRGMTLPILSVTILIVAAFSRYMRSAAMDTLAQDYIMAARARGLPERLVLYRHLVRNASLPMLTLVGLSIPFLLAGNVVVEDVFNYPGLGLLFFDALGIADYQVLLAWVLVGAALTIAGNLLADIALTVADPRIRLS